MKPLVIGAALAVLVGGGIAAAQAPQRAQPVKPGEVPARKKVVALPPRGTDVPAKTPWGDPDIAGPYTNSDESGIPFERPDEFAGRRLKWSVTFDDPHTWTKPWTFAMNLTRDESQPPFEYACHEGNCGLRNILAAARAEEKK